MPELEDLISGASFYDKARQYTFLGTINTAPITFTQAADLYFDVTAAANFNDTAARCDALLIMPVLTAAQSDVQFLDIAGEDDPVANDGAFTALSNVQRIRTARMEGGSPYAIGPIQLILRNDTARYICFRQAASMGDVTRNVSFAAVARRNG